MKASSAVIALSCLLAACMALPAAAQVATGQNRVCCAYIRNRANTAWQLVCNNPTGVSVVSRVLLRAVLAFFTVDEAAGIGVPQNSTNACMHHH